MYTKEEQELAYKKNLNVTSVVLVRMLNIINICTERGSFKPEELTFVGKLYDDLTGGVNATLELARKELEEKEKEKEELEEKKLETVEEEVEEIEETEEVLDTIQVRNSAGVQTSSD